MFKTSLILLLLLCPVPSFGAVWTAENAAIVRDKGDVTVSADVFKDGVLYEKFVAAHVDPATDPKALINARLSTLNSLDKYDVSTLGTVTYSPPVPPVVNAARELFISNLRTYQGYQQLLAAKLILVNFKPMTDLFAVIQTELAGHEAEYAPYVAGFRF